MERRFFRGLAQVQAEMKKTGSKRASGYDDGLGSTVLDAPEEKYAPEPAGRSAWQGRGPAPAGALHRVYGMDSYANEGYGNGGADGSGYEADETEYVPRRGNLKLRLRGFPRSIGGRIVLGVVVFCGLGAVAVAVAGVRYYLLHDPRFQVVSSDDIQIDGAQHLTRGQVLSVFGADLERNIFRVSLAEREADLERLPWVAHATVMRLLPDHIRVQITERTPVAFVRQGTQIGLADAGGVLLDMTPEAAGDPHYSFPVLTGLSHDLPLDTRAARMQVYEQFMAELRQPGEHLTDSLSEVDVSDPEDVKALIASGSSDILVHFGSVDYLKRYREFEQHVGEWKQQYPKLASADMRYAGQIVLEMQDGASSSAASSDAGTTVAMSAPAVAEPKATANVKPAQLKMVAAKVTKPAAMGPAAVAPVTAKAAVPKPAVSKPVGKHAAKKRAAVKKVVAKKRAGSGISSANAKEFAVLAAAHKAAMAKAANRGGAAQ